jgi:hypothetical protein
MEGHEEGAVMNAIEQVKDDWAEDVWTGGEIPKSVSIEEAKRAIRDRVAEIHELVLESLDERIELDYAPPPSHWSGIAITTEEHQRHHLGHVLGNLNAAHLALSDVDGC